MRHRISKSQLALVSTLCLSLLAGCAHDPESLPSALAASEAPRVLNYTLTLHPRYADVAIEVVRPVVAPYRFDVSDWEGGGFEARWYRFEASTAAGAPLVVEVDDSEVIVSGFEAGTSFTLRYMVVDQRDALSAGADSAMPLTTPERFLGFGHALFAVPVSGTDTITLYEEVRVRIEAPEGWDVRTSWGRNETFFKEADKLRESLVVAGGWRFASGEHDRSELYLATDGRWAGDVGATMSLVERMVFTQASVFGRYPIDAMLLVVVKGEQQPRGKTVSGALLLNAPPEIEQVEDVRLLRVLAAEHFRIWNGHLFRPASTESASPTEHSAIVPIGEEAPADVATDALDDTAKAQAPPMSPRELVERARQIALFQSTTLSDAEVFEHVRNVVRGAVMVAEPLESVRSSVEAKDEEDNGADADDDGEEGGDEDEVEEARVPSEPWPAWFELGVTEYYSVRTLMSMGLMTSGEFCAALNQWIRDYHGNPHAFVPLPGSHTRAAWRSGLAEALARSKGALLALLLDVQLRNTSGGLKSFDDLLRRVAFEFGGASKGYTTADVESLIAGLSRRDMSDFFARFVRGVEPLPLDLLDRAGILMMEQDVEVYDPGFELDSTGTRVLKVDAASSAFEAGLRLGDRVDGVQVSFDEVALRVVARQEKRERRRRRRRRRAKASPTLPLEVSFTPTRVTPALFARETTELFVDWFGGEQLRP